MAYILVVDDDDERVRGLVYDALSTKGHTICEVSNGRAALSICRKYGFDLIILDYSMPYMNGLEVAEQLCTDSPFILHTASFNDDGLVKDALNIGALGIIEKISNLSIFQQQIHQFLRRIQH